MDSSVLEEASNGGSCDPLFHEILKFISYDRKKVAERVRSSPPFTRWCLRGISDGQGLNLPFELQLDDKIRVTI
ncbi:unnamed protein product [Dovyalis caffra]|uniref:Uncharacterized protein n=1 Tax=Dovyalis caffra TaxID=77055 RepID=A0AAV1QTH0_9ROSI|nr:unnamed protein product [Dovyalis caffra]